MKRPAYQIFFLLFIAILLSGCEGSRERKLAIALPERCFELVKSGEFEELPPLYSTSFFQGTPKSALIRSMESFNRKLGRLESYKLTSWTFVKGDRTRGGNKLKFIFHVKYSRGKTKETFKVVSGRDGHYKITEHNIHF